MKNSLLILATHFLIASMYGQQITGRVLDQDSREPLTGAAVYFDGSTMGVVTDLQGNFAIPKQKNLLAPLIISHLGYQTLRIDLDNGIRKLIVELKEEAQPIPEVILTADPYSREDKLEVFRKEFLGDGTAGRRSSILNEDHIRLYFNTLDSSLTATSDAPLIIMNAHLAYKIRFDLREFTISFRSESLERHQNINYTRYSGFSRFEDVADREHPYERRRSKAYQGSPMQFMRLLWSEKLEGSSFVLSDTVASVNPGVTIERLPNPTEPFRLYRFKKAKLVVDYKRDPKFRSSLFLQGTQTISVDEFGNFAPYRDVVFGGYMADLRMADMLPMDYQAP